MWLVSPNLQNTHGFSGRHGGTSLGVYQSLNLSTRVGDDPNHVLENRRIALSALGLTLTSVAVLRQVHSSLVVNATEALNSEILPAADALVTNQSNTTLVIETADCYPVLLEDQQAGVIAAAHCGWRGTAARILEKTMLEMQQLGATPDRIRVAIGPGICAMQYPVHLNVLEEFIKAGFPTNNFIEQEAISESGSRLFHLDIAKANQWLLESLGVPAPSIWTVGKCSTHQDYFSYRRDHGQTGRMWSVISQTQ
jgi:polyphenol oxidase